MDHDPFEQDPLERASFPIVRLAAAVLVSLLVHAGVWGSSLVFEPFPTGSFKLNIDVRDNVKLMGLGMSSPKPKPPPEEVGPLEMVGVEPPPPPPPPRKPKAVAVKKKTRPRKPKPRKPDTELQRAEKPQPPRPDTDPNRRLGNAPAPAYIGDVPFEARDIPSVRSVAPGNAVASAIVDMRRVRNSPYKVDIDKLLKSYPDYHRVIGTAGQDPMETYDRFLVATTNPAMISQTLLLGEVRQPEQLRSEVNRIAGEELTWSKAQGVEIAQPDSVWWARRGNDPRVFVIPTAGVFALARRDQLPWFEARRQSARFFPAMPPPIDSERGALPAIVVAEFRLAPGSYGVDVAARLPMPSGASVALHDDRRPLIRVSLSFRSADEADDFEREWPRVQKGLMDMLVIRVGPFRGLIGRIKAQKDGDTGVYLEVRGTPNETRRLLAFVAHFIKSRTQYDHPRKDELPKPEPDKKETSQASEGGLWGDQGEEASSKRGEATLWGEPDPNKGKANTPADDKPSPSVGERLSKQLSGARDALKRPVEQEATQKGGGLFGDTEEADAPTDASGSGLDAADGKRASEDTVDAENAPGNPTNTTRDEADEGAR